MSAPAPAPAPDSHTLYIRTGPASKDQIAASFRAGVDALGERTGATYDYRFLINMPTDASGETFGFCYLFVTDPGLHRLALAGELVLPPVAAGGETVRLVAEACYVKEPKPQLAPHVLRSSALPAWLGAADMRAVFAPMVHGSAAQRLVEDAGAGADYPHVVITQLRSQRSGSGSDAGPGAGGSRAKGASERVALVFFAPGTADAQFALNMTRKIELAKGANRAMLYFDLAHQADVKRLG